jgi:hypothetical protein
MWDPKCRDGRPRPSKPSEARQPPVATGGWSGLLISHTQPALGVPHPCAFFAQEPALSEVEGVGARLIAPWAPRFKPRTPEMSAPRPHLESLHPDRVGTAAPGRPSRAQLGRYRWALQLWIRSNKKIRPPRKAEWNGVGCSAGHFPKGSSSGAPPIISVNAKRQTRVILPR